MNASGYLTRMGIEQWHQRKSLCVSLENVYQYFLGDVLAPCALVLCDANAQTTAEAELITAIIKAMRLPYVGGYQPQISALSLPTSVRVLVLLGQRCAEYVLQSVVDIRSMRASVIHWNNQQVFVSHSPQQLLQHKALKAETWQDIQLAMQLFA